MRARCRLKIARSRSACAISRRTQMDQTCFGSRGFFWPMSNPLFQGRRSLLIGGTDIGGAPPSRPPRRSIASASFILSDQSSAPKEALATGGFWREADNRQTSDVGYPWVEKGH